MGRYVELLVEAIADHGAGAARWALLTNRPTRLPAVLPPGAFLSAPARPSRPTLAWLQCAAPRGIVRAGADVALMTTGRAPLRCPVPYVLTVHDLTVIEQPALYPARERWLAAIWLRAAIRRAAAIACVSEATARDVRRAFPTLAVPIEVIHEATGRRFTAPAASGGVASDLGPRIWLHVGELARRKNVPRLIAAFAAVRGAVGDPPPILVLAGRSGPDRAAVDRAIADHGLHGAVRLLGWVPDADLAALYTAAELAVCASLHEGFGLPALEALASGVPLVSSLRGGLAEVVGDAALAADPEDEAAIAGALAALGGSAGLRAKLAAAGPRQAARFDSERTIRRTEALCALVALRRGTPRATMG